MSWNSMFQKQAYCLWLRLFRSHNINWLYCNVFQVSYKIFEMNLPFAIAVTFLPFSSKFVIDHWFFIESYISPDVKWGPVSPETGVHIPPTT